MPSAVQRMDIHSCLRSIPYVMLCVVRRCYPTMDTMHTLACTECAYMARQQIHNTRNSDCQAEQRNALRPDVYSPSCLCVHGNADNSSFCVKALLAKLLWMELLMTY